MPIEICNEYDMSDWNRDTILSIEIYINYVLK